MALKIVKNERVIMVDIDDTLVMHEFAKDIPGAIYVDVEDPLCLSNKVKLRVNEPMVRLVREEIVRGSQICYWSRGGFQWAYNVLKALDLDEYKSEQLVMTKPFAYFDDTSCEHWLKDRVYIDPDVCYKK